MIIYLRSDFNQYACRYEAYGYSWVQAVLYTRRTWVPLKKWLPFWLKWKLVFVGRSLPEEAFHKHTREDRVVWFYKAIHEHETWLREWAKQSKWETNEGEIK